MYILRRNQRKMVDQGPFFIFKNVIIKFEMCKHDNLEIKGPIKKLNVDMFDLSLASKKVIIKHDF